MKRADTLTSVLFVVLGAVAIYVASGYPPEARLIPIVVASGLMIVALVQIAGSVVAALGPLTREDPKVAYADAPTDRLEVKRAGFAMLSVVALFVLIYLTGIVGGLTLYVPLALFIHARKPVPVLAGAAVATFALSYGMFVALMELPLLGGLLN